jgi:DNA-binding response OmpR family regulator
MTGSSIIYFCSDPKSAELLGELMDLESCTLKIVSNREDLGRIIEKQKPRLIVLDHEKLREKTPELLAEARKLAGDQAILLPVVERNAIDRDLFQKLQVDSTLSPHFDFEALYCSVKRLMLPRYERWKRRDERITPTEEMKCILQHDNISLDLRTTNLSLSGALLEAPSQHELRPDHLVHLKLDAIVGKDSALEVTAITRWLTRNTLGVEFYEYNRRKIKEVLEEIQRNSLRLQARG